MPYPTNSRSSHSSVYLSAGMLEVSRTGDTGASGCEGKNLGNAEKKLCDPVSREMLNCGRFPDLVSAGISKIVRPAAAELHVSYHGPGTPPSEARYDMSRWDLLLISTQPRCPKCIVLRVYTTHQECQHVHSRRHPTLAASSKDLGVYLQALRIYMSCSPHGAEAATATARFIESRAIEFHQRHGP
jgi:hypothetical protein